MPGGERLWRTEKGDLVRDGHPEALILAYGASDELSDDDKSKVRGSGKVHTPKVEDAPTPKKQAKASPKD
jgi:hypothetical protein